MSIWVALILKQDTKALQGEHSDLCFVEADSQTEAITQVANNKWDEPWGKGGISKCVILKIIELCNVPSKLLVGQDTLQCQIVLDSLRKLSEGLENSQEESLPTSEKRVRKKKEVGQPQQRYRVRRKGR